jgi:hypothetical protein
MQSIPANKQASNLDIFICHSNKDKAIAEALINLLRAALNIPAERIRCTSVDGYRLPAGALTDEQLRREIYEARVFIGLITNSSLKSIYVLFELGARWGARLYLIPVLASGADSSILHRPLAGFNTLSCDVIAQVHQLINDIASYLNVNLSYPSSYQKYINALVESSRQHKEQSQSNSFPIKVEVSILSDIDRGKANHVKKTMRVALSNFRQIGNFLSGRPKLAALNTLIALALALAFITNVTLRDTRDLRATNVETLKTTNPVGVIRTSEGRLLWVDGDASIIARMTPQDKMPDFFIRGWDESITPEALAENRERVQTYQQLVREFQHNKLSERVSEVDLADTHNVRTLLAGDDSHVEVRLGSTNYGERLAKALDVLDEQRSKPLGPFITYLSAATQGSIIITVNASSLNSK